MVSTPRSIALFHPNWIGDVVMATPAIRAVRERYPLARVLAVCRPYVADVVAGSPWFDATIRVEKGRNLRSIREIRDERPDLAVLFPNSWRSALTARLGGCRHIVGFSKSGRRMLLSTALTPRPGPSPIIDEYNRLVQPLDVGDPGHRMELFTTPDDERAADSVWERFLAEGGPVIGLNPGGAFGSAKFWPVESFAKLAGELHDRRGASVLVLCGPGERDQAQRIVAQANRPRVFSLADEPMSIGLSKACVRRLDLLVTTDSGPRHFAAAFDVPVVTLFGPTHIEWTETYFPKAVHLQKSVPCGPCQLRVCPLDHRCMRELGVDEVLQAIASLLPVPEERRHAG